MRLPFRPTFWPTVFTVPAILVMIGLSIWQVQRLQWKEGLIAERVERTTAAPITLPVAGTDLTPFEFRRVSVTGSFDHAHEFFLAARSQNGNVGFWIITPLKTEPNGPGGGETVLVNRGWVPDERKAPERRAEGQVAGSVTVNGVLRLPQVKAAFQPDNEPQKNTWFYLDPAQIVSTSGLQARADLYIDSDATPNPGGFPIGGQTRVHLPNDHLQYAVTWALLALSLAGVYVVYHLKLERERGSR
jgi:surfeit locus 1 family protein